MSAYRVLSVVRKSQRKHFSTTSTTILGILEQVQSGKLDCKVAEALIAKAANPTPEDALRAFANLDHTRSSRTGFPEAVFAEGKTPEQVATILDDFARNLNEEIRRGEIVDSRRAILATR
jgi:NCAIR mutase (PurE)-related protein